MIFNYIIIVLVINFLIFAFYYYFKTNWPEEYFGPEDKFSLAISISFKRLVLFRVSPVFAISFLVFSYANLEISKHEWFVLGVATLLIYASLTSGMSITKLIRNSPTVKQFTNKPTQFLYHIVSIILLITIGAVASYMASFDLFNYLNQNVRSLVDNIVAALLYTAILIPIYKLYINLVEKSHEGVELIIIRSINQIKEDKKLFDKIKSICNEENAKMDLVLAFCVVENIQRPKWFRMAENFIPFPSTKGIMQVKTKRRLSDEESIQLSVKEYFKNTNTYTIDENFLNELINRYNGKKNDNYLSFIERALSSLDYSWNQTKASHL